MIFLAHGIGGIRDLPIPESYFFVTAAVVLVVSFVLLLTISYASSWGQRPAR